MAYTNDRKKFERQVPGSRQPVHHRFAGAVRLSAKPLREGKVLCIDPGSSRFGWAIFHAGELHSSGSAQTQGRHIQQRLKWQAGWIAETFSGMEFDVLILEQPYEPTSSTIYSLYNKVMKSIGLFQALLPYKYLLDIRPSTWQSYASPDWEKTTDEADAVEMGRAVLEILDSLTTGPAGEREMD